MRIVCFYYLIMGQNLIVEVPSSQQYNTHNKAIVFVLHTSSGWLWNPVANMEVFLKIYIILHWTKDFQIFLLQSFIFLNYLNHWMSTDIM